MADDYEAVDVSKIPGYPKEFSSATGKVFFHGEKDYSTHLNIVVGDDTEGYRVIPMLVPGQTNIGGLLKGQKATQAQYRVAEDWARANMPEGVAGVHKSVAEALAAETAWHDKAQGALGPVLEQYQSQRKRRQGVMTGGGHR